jgi:pimeloyl-ACP methyl ester carboxylesterase
MPNESSLILILLPGMDGTGELFENLLAELPPTIKTLVVRYPTESFLTYAELIGLADLKIPKNTPYVLLGESFSGPIAIALASQLNKQLKGVILSCTFAINPRPLLSKWSFLVPSMTINDKILKVISKLLMSKFKNEIVFKQLEEAMLKISPKIIRARLDEVIEVNYLEELAKINVPILYLKGKYDHLVPASASKIIVKYAKNVTLVELDAPHLLLQIAAKKSAKEISRFLEKITLNLAL